MCGRLCPRDRSPPPSARGRGWRSARHPGSPRFRPARQGWRRRSRSAASRVLTLCRFPFLQPFLGKLFTSENFLPTFSLPVPSAFPLGAAWRGRAPAADSEVSGKCEEAPGPGDGVWRPRASAQLLPEPAALGSCPDRSDSPAFPSSRPACSRTGGDRPPAGSPLALTGEQANLAVGEPGARQAGAGL